MATPKEMGTTEIGRSGMRAGRAVAAEEGESPEQSSRGSKGSFEVARMTIANTGGQELAVSMQGVNRAGLSGLFWKVMRS